MLNKQELCAQLDILGELYEYVVAIHLLYMM